VVTSVVLLMSGVSLSRSFSSYDGLVKGFQLLRRGPAVGMDKE